MAKSKLRVAPEHGRGTGIPHPVDIHVGKRLRTRRLLLGMNQETLAAAVNLTFQQVQKYEGGANRVSGSRLSEFSKVLDVPVAYFFAGLPTEDDTDEERAYRSLIEQPETLELVKIYIGLPNDEIRGGFLQMTKLVSGRAA